MSLTDFDFSEKQYSTLKNFISKLIDEKLKDYILIPKQYFIDEHGYKYIFTEESFVPLDSSFKEDLQQAQKEMEKGEIVEHNEFWEKKFKFDWEGGLSDIKEKFTSVELQHKALWR